MDRLTREDKATNNVRRYASGIIKQLDSGLIEQAEAIKMLSVKEARQELINYPSVKMMSEQCFEKIAVNPLLEAMERIIK